MLELVPGDIVWTQPNFTVGSEQAGRRPALVVAGSEYLTRVERLAVVVPITTVDRGWPNHIVIEGGGLARASWAMSEQLQTISRRRIFGLAGRVEPQTVMAVRKWIAAFLDLPSGRPGAPWAS